MLFLRTQVLGQDQLEWVVIVLVRLRVTQTSPALEYPLNHPQFGQKSGELTLIGRSSPHFLWAPALRYLLPGFSGSTSFGMGTTTLTALTNLNCPHGPK